jgi:hypothetical protein
MKLRAGAAVMVVCAIGVSGCKGITTGAKEHFSKDFSCPEDRVEVRERADLHASDGKERDQPSKEIAADPARLKMWQAAQDSARASSDSDETIVEARGCGHETLQACHRHNKDPSYIMCFGMAYPVGVAKW